MCPRISRPGELQGEQAPQKTKASQPGQTQTRKRLQVFLRNPKYLLLIRQPLYHPRRVRQQEVQSRSTTNRVFVVPGAASDRYPMATGQAQQAWTTQ